MSKLKTFLNGAAIGAGMSVPGISGGTMAIMLGIYNDLLYSVANILKDSKKSLTYLTFFCLGGAGGLLLAAWLISFILSTPAELPLRSAFLGAAAGCIPPVLKRAQLLPLSPKKALIILAGMAIAAVISLLPENLFTAGEGVFGVVMQISGGALVAAALVLPGISASQLLYMLGMYKTVMERISCGDILGLLPMALGLAVGIFLTARLLSSALERSDSAYLLILGFMIFSLYDMIPQWHSPSELIIGVICAVGGFVAALLLTRGESRKISQDIAQ